jgi:hypothetical protein
MTNVIWVPESLGRQEIHATVLAKPFGKQPFSRPERRTKGKRFYVNTL